MQSRPRDSLTHLFLQCPRFAAARLWLQQLWVAICGPEAPPPPVDDAAVMLGGAPWRQESAPNLLWHTLRALFIHAVWCAYRSPDPSCQTSHAVAVQVVEEARRLMHCQWSMAAQLGATVDALPVGLLTAQVRARDQADVVFLRTWAVRDVLCCMVEAPGGRGSSLEIRLTVQHPVPVPAAPVEGVG